MTKPLVRRRWDRIFMARMTYFCRRIRVVDFLAFLALLSCMLTAAPVLAEVSVTQLPADSLFQVNTSWITSTGGRLRLAELRGRPVVITMGFTSCDYSCPIVMGRLKKIEQALSPVTRAGTMFVYISFDSERDTPDVLERYRQRMNLGAGTWRMLRGSMEEVMEIAVLLGIKYRRDEKEGFTHSNVITLLNGQGQPVIRQEGLNADLAPLVAAIEGLPKNQVPK